MNRTVKYGLLGLSVLLAGCAVCSFFYVKTFGPRLRVRVVEALTERFDADVELESLDFQLYPQPRVSGEGLSIRHRGWSDAHPLIYVRRFQAETGYLTLAAGDNKVNLVNLEGLEIHLPPRGSNERKVRSRLNTHATQDLRFLIHKMVANGALLEIEPKNAGKDPLQYKIHELTVETLGPGQPMKFVSKLVNAKPPGLIDSTGHFGPWQRDEPRSTPVSGDYTFRNADLGVFKGISGTLSSVGEYHGELQHIDVNGKTDVPDFSLQPKGDPVRLTTQFHSVVDGTNGDTLLDPVDATFLQSEFICRGGVVHLPGRPGKTVSLLAVPKHARMEDILKLVIGGKQPVVTGAVDFQTRIEIPPGSGRVIDKLKLDGSFNLEQAFFTNPNVQRRLNALSERARGISRQEAERDRAPTATAASDLRVKFRLNHGVATLSRISFRVPAARVDLAGVYNMVNEKVDIKGKFAMQATLSDTQSGLRHWLLKPLDPLFKKNGAGFEVPLEITGTKDQPQVDTTILHKKIRIH